MIIRRLIATSIRFRRDRKQKCNDGWRLAKQDIWSILQFVAQSANIFLIVKIINAQFAGAKMYGTAKH